MATINCPDCEKPVSPLAEACPHCARPKPGKSAATQDIPQLTIPQLTIPQLPPNIWKYAGYGALAVFTLVVGCSVLNKGPSCKFGPAQVRSTTFYNDGLDYGFSVSAPVTNVGNDGEFVVRAQLSTSQGTFQRRTKYYLRKGESMRVQFDFSEPSMSVGSNVQPLLSCE